eukprot:gnl/Carplike_NY0171/1875_a2544_710.p1 GENE.gnl/Carplike_NY0171/1875_a2544_710~~gnl/Carplike_NY0171/1875_a2544_710.p1  ORF type:complete len:808 (+),score=233.72 gnl/Carplike_NY0171/1875_a2544_710:26-2425(+)
MAGEGSPTKETCELTIKHEKEFGGSAVVNNRYVLASTLGKGAFGTVKYAIDKFNGQEYAVKIIFKKKLLAKKGGDKTLLECVYREIAVMKKLHHDNICRLIEVIHSEKSRKIIMIMELLDGPICNITEYMHEGAIRISARPLPIPLLRSYIRNVVDGLLYLKGKGLIHGDIKCPNLLRSSNGVAKVADFSLVALASNLGKARVGSPAFQPPESLLEGSRAKPSFSGDSWGLGVSLYIMTFGAHPFEVAPPRTPPKGKESVSQRAARHLFSSIIHNPLVFPGPLLPSLEELLRGMLEKDPEKRWTLEQINECAFLTSDISEQEKIRVRVLDPTGKHTRESLHDPTRLTPDDGLLNAAAVLQGLSFETRTTIRLNNRQHKLSCLQEVLLILHSVVNIFTLVGRVFVVSRVATPKGLTGIKEYDDLVIYLKRRFAAVLVDPSYFGKKSVEQQLKEILAFIKQWRKLVEEKILLHNQGNQYCDYLRNFVMPVFDVRLKELFAGHTLVTRNFLSAPPPERPSLLSGEWELVSVQSILSRFVDTCAAINLSPDSQLDHRICVIGNERELLNPKYAFVEPINPATERGFSADVKTRVARRKMFDPRLVHRFVISLGIESAGIPGPIEDAELASETESTTHETSGSRTGEYSSSSGPAVLVTRLGDGSLEKSGPFGAFWDKMWMPSVMEDLFKDMLLNARKYSPPSTIRCWMVNDPQRRVLHFRLCDGGVGVGVGDVVGLVQLLVKGESEGRRVFGKGFGLLKAFYITQALGGSFRVTSHPQAGTTVIIEIPHPPGVEPVMKEEVKK